MVRKLFGFPLFLLAVACIPEPAGQDLFSLLVARNSLPVENPAAIEGDCLFAGLSATVAGSAILGCVRHSEYNCAALPLYLKTETTKTALIQEIETVSNSNANCLIPAALARNEFDGLTVSAYYLLNRSGGSSGPHTSANFAIKFTTTTCAALGLEQSPYLREANRQTTREENEFLSSAKGLVALKDDTGDCRNTLGLSASQTAMVAEVRNNTIAFNSVCDYGADDPNLPDCPASLRDDAFLFNTVTGW